MKIYVTYTAVSLLRDDKMRFAVECDNMEQALEIASELNSRTNVKNIRLNKCGRGLPEYESAIFTYYEYKGTWNEQ